MERQKISLTLVLAAAVLACDSAIVPTAPEPESSTGTIRGSVMAHGAPVAGAEVALTGGDFTRTTISGDYGLFAFDAPPGSYTLTAAAPAATCEQASATVAAGQLATVRIDCGFRPPLGSEIPEEGGLLWNFSRRTGTCPAPLGPPGWGASLACAFEAGASELTMVVGLEPAVTIVGTYDAASGRYTGRSAGPAAIQTRIEGEFHWYWISFSNHWRVGFAGAMTREHRADLFGDPICTEVYEISSY